MEGRLRLREPQITTIEGGFLVSDPYGVYEKPLALTDGGLFLLSLMELSLIHISEPTRPY